MTSVSLSRSEASCPRKKHRWIWSYVFPEFPAEAYLLFICRMIRVQILERATSLLAGHHEKQFEACDFQVCDFEACGFEACDFEAYDSECHKFELCDFELAILKLAILKLPTL